MEVQQGETRPASTQLSEGNTCSESALRDAGDRLMKRIFEWVEKVEKVEKVVEPIKGLVVSRLGTKRKADDMSKQNGLGRYAQ